MLRAICPQTQYDDLISAVHACDILKVERILTIYPTFIRGYGDPKDEGRFCTPLGEAVSSPLIRIGTQPLDYLSLIRMLCENYAADVNQPSRQGTLPLRYTTESDKQFPLFLYLLSRGADFFLNISTDGRHNFTPWEIACGLNHQTPQCSPLVVQHVLKNRIIVLTQRETTRILFKMLNAASYYSLEHAYKAQDNYTYHQNIVIIISLLLKAWMEQSNQVDIETTAANLILTNEAIFYRLQLRGSNFKDAVLQLATQYGGRFDLWNAILRCVNQLITLETTKRESCRVMIGQFFLPPPLVAICDDYLSPLPHLSEIILAAKRGPSP